VFCETRCRSAVTSNIALSEWGAFLGDATLTAAILDRLAMHAIRIDVDGPSYRLLSLTLFHRQSPTWFDGSTA